MSISQQLDEIEQVQAAALALAENGEIQAARRELKKIENFYFVKEVDRANILVRAKIMEKQGKATQARQMLLDRMSFLWGFPEAFKTISKSNPKVDKFSRKFYVEVLGGCANMGLFLQFTERHITAADIVANTHDEAFKYLAEAANFAEPQKAKILNVVEAVDGRPVPPHRGIVQTYPFRLME